MSVLYMGPIAAVALMARFRANRDGQLNSNRDDAAVHPAGVLRILVLAYVVKELNIKDSDMWFDFILNEVRKDFDSDELGMRWKQAKKAAQCVAQTIMNTPIVNGSSLKNIRCWNDADEDCVREYLGQPKLFSHLPIPQLKTPHIVAAANQHLLTREVLTSSTDARISKTFKKMIQSIKLESEKPCNKCALTSRNVYPVCQVSQPLLAIQNNKNENGDPWLFAIVIGAIIVIGSVVFFSYASNGSRDKPKKSKNDSCAK